MELGWGRLSEVDHQRTGWSKFNPSVPFTCARYEKVHTTSSSTTTTHYLGDMEIIYGTSTEYRHLIRAAGTVIAVLKDTGTTSTDYIHRDHLGSLTTITNSNGAERLYRP